MSPSTTYQTAVHLPPLPASGSRHAGLSNEERRDTPSPIRQMVRDVRQATTDLANVAEQRRAMLAPTRSAMHRIAHHPISKYFAHEVVQGCTGTLAGVALVSYHAGADFFGGQSICVGSIATILWGLSSMVQAAGRGPRWRNVTRSFAESIGYGVAGVPVLLIGGLLWCCCDAPVPNQDQPDDEYSSLFERL